MDKRPLAVTIVSWIYIVTGAGGLVRQLTEFKGQNPFQYDFGGIALISLIAVVAGVFMLRRRNWARWLALAWIAFHVVVSAFHGLGELAIHSLFLVILSYLLLWRSEATRYFLPAEVPINPS